MKKYYRGNGYIAYYLPSHHRSGKTGLVYEHIIIAEEKLGRELVDGEVVHHEDENKHNNHPDNLYVFKTDEDHSRFHKTGLRIQVEDFWVSPKVLIKSKCNHCDKEFEYEKGNSKGHYCSNKCFSLSQRRVERPTKDELLNLIKTESFLEIGRMYGVSDNAIRKWCKEYGLPRTKKEIKNLL